MSYKYARLARSLIAGTLLVFLPNDRSGAQQTTISAFVTDSHVLSLSSIRNFRCKITPVQPGYGIRAQGQPGYQANLKLPDCQADALGSGVIPLEKLREIQIGRSSVVGFSATDMSYHGGPLVQSAQSFFLALNCNQPPFASCWGNPGAFVSDLSASDFIHITDQYVNSTVNGRYSLANVGVNLTGTTQHIMQATDIQAAVIAGVRALFPNGGGGGYGNIYHLFLPQGQDTCIGSACYSPDNPSTFAFCAYHSRMDVPDARGNFIHVLYTVIPYANVPGCQVTTQPFPNGQLADSINNTLSHETFELITDPDPLSGWYYEPLGSQGEIGDLCYLDKRIFSINNRLYEVQSEYDNRSHSCATGSNTTPPPTCTISYTPSTVSLGQSLSINWTSANATSRYYQLYDSNNVLFYTSPGLSLNGSLNIPSLTDLAGGTYTRRDTVTGSGGTATCSATLTVVASAPTCTISYTPSTVNLGQGLSISWSSTNATSRNYQLYDSNNVLFYTSPALSLNGSINIPSLTDLAAGTYTRRDTVTGSGGTATCSATLTVVSSGPTCTISYSPSTVALGQSLSVSWTETNATSRYYQLYDSNNTLFYTSPPLSLDGSLTIPSLSGLAVGTYARRDTVNGPTGTGTCSATLTVTSPGQAILDIWTTSVFSYASGGGGPGGGLADDTLRVGGFGDLYYSLMEFDLTGLPKAATRARIRLYDLNSSGGTPTNIYLYQITQYWNWQTQGTGSDRLRLWWADQPNAILVSGPLPAPTVGAYYYIDITNLYNGWQNGSIPNYGVELRPANNANNFDFFASSRNANTDFQPVLVIE